MFGTHDGVPSLALRLSWCQKGKPEFPPRLASDLVAVSRGDCRKPVGISNSLHSSSVASICSSRLRPSPVPAGCTFRYDLSGSCVIPVYWAVVHRGRGLHFLTFAFGIDEPVQVRILAEA